MPNSKECKSEYLTQLKLHKIEKCIDNLEKTFTVNNKIRFYWFIIKDHNIL